jgi:hypothetical protein
VGLATAHSDLQQVCIYREAASRLVFEYQKHCTFGSKMPVFSIPFSELMRPPSDRSSSLLTETNMRMSRYAVLNHFSLFLALALDLICFRFPVSVAAYPSGSLGAEI